MHRNCSFARRRSFARGAGTLKKLKDLLKNVPKLQETTCLKGMFSIKTCSKICSRRYIWVFPKIVVPPNHPF